MIDLFPPLLPTPALYFSPDHKRNVRDGIVSGIGRKWKGSDSSDADSVTYMTLLTTLILNFHYVISALTTPLTIPIPTQSLEKNSL